LKKALTTAPLLVHPNYEKPFIVQCDASINGVGALLAQCDENGIERPIAYMSKKLNRSQRNYSTTELECLAVVLAIKRFRMYIEGHEFTVVTDHASLRWLMTQQDLQGRLARWALKLQGFNFSIEHRRGSENVVADAISRSFESDEGLATIDIDVLPEIDVESEFFQSSSYSQLKEKLTQSQLPDFQVIDGFLYHRVGFSNSSSEHPEDSWKLVVPVELREGVIKAAHDQPSSSHCGIAKCLENIRRKFYWPRMVVDVRNYIKNCEICRTTKYPTQKLKPPIGQQIVSERVFQRLYIDFIGPFPRTKRGNIGIFIVLDHLSKFTFLKPVKKFTTQVVVSYLKEEIFDCYGTHEVIVSDNGSQFKSHEFSFFFLSMALPTLAPQPIRRSPMPQKELIGLLMLH